MPVTRRPRRILGWGSYSESLRIGAILRRETVGGALLVAAAIVATALAPANDVVAGPVGILLGGTLGAVAGVLGGVGAGGVVNSESPDEPGDTPLERKDKQSGDLPR